MTFPKNLAGGMIAFAVMALIIGMVAGLFLIHIPEGNAEVVLVVFGQVVGWGGLIVGFHYGSSHGSKAKDEVLAAHVAGVPGSAKEAARDVADTADERAAQIEELPEADGPRMGGN